MNRALLRDGPPWAALFFFWRIKMKKIKIPLMKPRHYQVPALRALSQGFKRIVLVHHRRAGKDVLTLNMMVNQMMQRVGYYLYIFPTAALARRVIWQGATKDGFRFLDFIPEQLIKKKQEQSMLLELHNGSIFQLVGSDRFTNVGINPIYVTFSEFSLQDPSCWNYIRPILAENDGIAVFQGTPRGKQHFYDLYQMAKKNDAWFTQLLSVEDTGAISLKAIEQERQSGMSEELIRQEFFCSFSRGVEGSYYSRLLNKADLAGRITNVPPDPHASVNTAWDLGIRDSTSIIFYQRCGQEIHIIDFYEAHGEGFSHYSNVLRQKAQENEWVYGDHFAPHDIQVREMSSGAMTRKEAARQLGIDFQVVPNIPLMDGIECGRSLFPRLWIDQNKCSYLLKCLESYHKTYNEKMGVYGDRPFHDYASHGADSYRYLAISEKAAASSTGELSVEAWEKIRRKGKL